MTGSKSGKKNKKSSKKTLSRSSSFHSEDLGEITQEPGPTSSVVSQETAKSLPPKPRDSEALLKRASLIKLQGNQEFSSHKFTDALHTYQSALKFLPEGHLDAAIIHCNSAACYLQINPVNYNSVVNECNLALSIDPELQRALVRRARGYIGLRNNKLAIEDLTVALKLNPENKEAIEFLKKLQSGGATHSHGHHEEDESDRWFYSLSKLIQNRLGFDPFHSDESAPEARAIIQAIEETVSREEASPLLEAAESKFRQMTASSLLNWGNTHRTLALRKFFRKSLPEGKESDSQNPGDPLPSQQESEAEPENVNPNLELDGKNARSSVDKERLSLELEQCDWSMNHLELAIQKLSQAVELQPDLVDATMAKAVALSKYAEAMEKRALINESLGNSVSRAMLDEIQDMYNDSLLEFVNFQKFFDKIEREFEQHKVSCTDPGHSHSHDHDGGKSAFVSNVNSYKRQITTHWIQALVRMSHFQYKTGNEKWKSHLQSAKAMEPNIKGTEFGQVDFFEHLPFTMRKLVNESAERLSDEVDNDANKWESPWKKRDPAVKPAKQLKPNSSFKTAETPEINTDLRKPRLVSTLERDEAARAGKKEAGRAVSSETDEPMTPVADLVGKFLSLSKQGY